MIGTRRIEEKAETGNLRPEAKELEMWKRRTGLAVAYLAAIVLPAVGVLCVGLNPTPYLEFPPLTRYVEHAGFNWIIFVGLAIFILAVILPLDVWVWWSRRAGVRAEETLNRRRFPWWGWVGLFFGVFTWILAWTRYEWFSSLQIFTFSPLWFAYIVVVNALTYRRTGHCMLRDRPVSMFKLFVMSAIFWWYFEYLNRFVQNWYYTECDGLTKMQYFIFATLPFSTVLPAVLGTYELLDSYGGAGAGLDGFVQVRVRRPNQLALLGLVAAGVGLALIGIYPDYLFPLLWVSPLLIIVSMQKLGGQRTILSALSEGRWRKVYLLACAALICGFFWEMWNMFSFAKWIYTVPYVGEFKLFEMPVLGYSGYLPFGLECAVIAELIGYKDCRECGEHAWKTQGAESRERRSDR